MVYEDLGVVILESRSLASFLNVLEPGVLRR